MIINDQTTKQALLNEIIKADSDRLFVLDNECYIIFTGETIDDEKPFIRIGNYIDLPVKAIPLIENIIITDSLVGNPAYEQFNIDIKYLSANRYVGTKSLINAYLNFQKTHGLDLTEASVTEVEDVPTLSTDKIIFTRDAFVGIFHFNGNFRIVYNKNELLNLLESQKESLSDIDVHEKLSELHKHSVRYSGSGVVFINAIPFFYKNRLFSSYMFPNRYFELFNRLHIDPAAIKEIFLPVYNANICKFIKWKNNRQGRVKVFSDAKDEFDALQKLYIDVSIARQDFSELAFDSGEQLQFLNYKDSVSLKIIYKNVKPSYKDLTISYIREFYGLETALKEKPDAIMIPYGLFEQCVLLFKSSTVPVLIVDDGNKNINKATATVLYSGCQYDFNNYKDKDALFEDGILFLNPGLHHVLRNLEEEGINEIINIKPEEHDRIDLLNLCSVFKIFINSTKSRKLSSQLAKIVQKIDALLVKENFYSQLKQESVKIYLYFHDKSVYQFIERLDIKSAFSDSEEAQITETAHVVSDISETPEEKINGESIDLYKELDPQKEGFYRRIIYDRKRFLNLLALYDTKAAKEDDILFMEKEIQLRKNNLLASEVVIDLKELKKKKRERIIKRVSAVLILCILASLLYLFGPIAYESYKKYKENIRIENLKKEQIEAEQKKAEQEKVEAQKQKQEKEDLISKYQIHVSDQDIYFYANKVALKNGYREISFKNLKEKNPNWIFPGNVFYMLDNEKVTVKYGDTLWEYSHQKLMKKHIEFYKIIDEIKNDKIQKDKIPAALKKASEFAFSKKHFDLLKELKDISGRDNPNRQH